MLSIVGGGTREVSAALFLYVSMIGFLRFLAFKVEKRVMNENDMEPQPQY